MDETHITTNSFKAWVLASRPKTLTGAAVPVLVGSALAVSDAFYNIRWLPCALCFLFAFIMQIDANLVNDYFDFRHGNDDAATRLGPQRACSMGWITPRAMFWGIGITTVLACLVGLPLVLYGGWAMIAVGMLCVAFCFLYTVKLSYWGLGDLLVLVFFGLIPVTLTYYLCVPDGQQAVPLDVVLASLACGFVIDTLLLVNNTRDVDNDRRDGKLTLVVRVGRRGGQILYLLSGCIGLFLNAVLIFSGWYWAFLLPLMCYLPLHILSYRHLVSIGSGRELNRVLGETARNMFIFGLSTAFGCLL